MTKTAETIIIFQRKKHNLQTIRNNKSLAK